MPAPPLPLYVSRFLIPDAKPAAPDGFTLVDQGLVNGLPFAIPIGPSTNLVVTAPTGQGRRWPDLDPATLVTSSGPELDPSTRDPRFPIGDVSRLPARLYLQRSGVTIASIPLVAGLRRLLPESGETTSGAPVDVIILSWEIHAGTLCGPGDFGSRIRLAWRLASQAVAFFAPLPLNPFASVRIAAQVQQTKPELSVQSVVGVRDAQQPQRFQLRKVVLR